MQAVKHRLIHPLPIGKAQLHLGGMHIYIQALGIYRKIQHGEGVFVLHHKGLIGLLYGPCHNLVLNVAPVDEIVLVSAGGACQHRLPYVSRDGDAVSLPVNPYQAGRCLPAEHRVNQVLYIAVSRGVELVLIVLDKADGDIRPGEGDLLHQGGHMAALGRRRL